MNPPLHGSEPPYAALTRWLCSAASPVMFWLLDPREGIRYVSPNVGPWLGWTPEEFRQAPFREWLSPESRAVAAGPLEAWIAQLSTAPLPPTALPAELAFRHRDGRLLWAEADWGLLPDPASASALIVVATRDITARKLRESERDQLLAEAQRSLEKFNKLKGYLPICARCKNIRDDRGYWNRIELFVQEHTEAVFTHGLCPACTRELYPDLFGRLGL